MFLKQSIQKNKKAYVFIAVSFVFMMLDFKNSILNVIVYSSAVAPLAIVLGRFTDAISNYIGEKRGGLLAAAFGNIPELIMGIWSLRYGMISMVKSALIGSIISNMLLVLGMTIFLGGIRYKEQSFDKTVARMNFNMLFMAMSSIIIISSLGRYNRLKEGAIFSLSIYAAVILMIVYVLGLIFSLYSHRNLFVVCEPYNESSMIHEKFDKSIIWLIIIDTILLYFISQKLISNVKSVSTSYNISEKFLGIIIIPVLGNIGENISSIMGALNDKINLSLEIAIGSSIQISLFVTPLLMILSYFAGHPISFIFESFEIATCIIAGGMSFIVFADGKTYWFEGAILMSIYIMITLAYYYAL